MKKILVVLLALFTTFLFAGCSEAAKEIASDIIAEVETSETETDLSAESSDEEIQESEVVTEPETQLAQELAVIDENGVYTTKEDVSLYIYTYDCLPQNFITKKEAQALGWEGGSLEPFAPGKCIGGNHFGNYEGILPEEDGRTYTECDIDTLGADKRGAKRIVFSNDGLIYYTEDHYKTFELLYGEE